MCYYMDAPQKDLNMNFPNPITPIPSSSQSLPPLLIPAKSVCSEIIREPKSADRVRLPPISCILNEISTSPQQQRFSPLEPQYLANNNNFNPVYGQHGNNNNMLSLSRASSFLSVDMNRSRNASTIATNTSSPNLQYSTSDVNINCSNSLPKTEHHSSIQHIINDIQPPSIRSSPVNNDSHASTVPHHHLHSYYSSSKPTLPSLVSSPSSTASSPPPERLVSPSLSLSPPAGSAASKVSKASKTSQSTRKRYKCPVCCKSVANLITHSSIHLAVNSRPHACTTCGRSFARSNDLQRHIKRHIKNNYDAYDNKGSISGGETFTIFKCPFFSNNGEHQCHQNGVFSRVDTFKNHLKAIHFKYPLGTKKKERASVDGYCKLCDKHFDNVGLWLNNHVLVNQCPGIITKQTLQS